MLTHIVCGNPDLKQCTGLSHTVVASGAVGSVIYGLLQPSPTNPSTTLLNADIALQFVPAMLFGVGVGAHFHIASADISRLQASRGSLRANTHAICNQALCCCPPCPCS